MLNALYSRMHSYCADLGFMTCTTGKIKESKKEYTRIEICGVAVWLLVGPGSVLDV